MTEPIRTQILTPDFVYTEPVQIVRQFLEDIGRAIVANDAEAVEMVLNGATSDGYFAAREAMREILTQDIELQIANKTFPLPRRG